MKAFETDRLDNTFLVNEATHLHAEGFINEQQLGFIESKLPVYQQHSNIFARIGLILLGFLLYSACSTFVGVIIFPLSSNSENSFTVVSLFNATVGFFALEFMLIRRMKYFGHGIDDAFLFCAQLCLLVAVGFLIHDTNDLTGVFMAALLLGIFCCVRYVDSFSALLACIGLAALIANLCLTSGSVGKMILPFVLMLVAAGIYVIALWLKKMFRAAYYEKSLQACFLFSAFLFYVSGNYFVVREMGSLLMNSHPTPGSDIPLAFVFYAFTFLTPLGFIYFSVLKKNRALLWLGIFAFGFSIFSIRYYYHFMPAEVALILGGMLLFGIAFFAMRKLKGKTSGVTFEPDRQATANDVLSLEALWLIENYHTGQTTNVHPGAEAGGGEFGGAGSAGKF